MKIDYGDESFIGIISKLDEEKLIVEYLEQNGGGIALNLIRFK